MSVSRSVDLWRLGPALALLGGVALSATQASAPAADAAFSAFFDARTPREAAAAADQIDDALRVWLDL